MTPVSVRVIGGGLAGCEAAWQLAVRDVDVVLHEMRPGVMTPAHSSGDLAELVCSNSFKGTDTSSATGTLKQELNSLGSLVLTCAERSRVPAGGALAVDRGAFAAHVSEALETHPRIAIDRREVSDIGPGYTIVATGPLTSPALEDSLSALVGSERLSFFDAAAPILDGETIDRAVCFAASRYGKGGGADYLNCPLDREEYESLMSALVAAERVHAHDFETKELFQACQPIEEVARTGLDSLRFGALKPVGLVDPATGERPWAVIQLRPENMPGTAYNLVGFQTNLTFPEQRRIVSMIPGLANARIVRYGVMHRNTFVDAPRCLDVTLRTRRRSDVRLAGQLTGTEGYLEAAATGLLAGVNTCADLLGMEHVVLPETTALGALIRYATDPDTTSYQPMHVNWGLVPPLNPPVRGKRNRYAAYADRARADLLTYISSHPLLRDHSTSTTGERE